MTKTTWIYEEEDFWSSDFPSRTEARKARDARARELRKDGYATVCGRRCVRHPDRVVYVYSVQGEKEDV